MKPHITWHKLIKRWRCIGSGAVGLGLTPASAFARWAVNAHGIIQ